MSLQKRIVEEKFCTQLTKFEEKGHSHWRYVEKSELKRSLQFIKQTLGIEIRNSRLNNVPIIWLILREINSMAGILFLREFLITLQQLDEKVTENQILHYLFSRELTKPKQESPKVKLTKKHDNTLEHLNSYFQEDCYKQTRNIFNVYQSDWKRLKLEFDDCFQLGNKLLIDLIYYVSYKYSTKQIKTVESYKRYIRYSLKRNLYRQYYSLCKIKQISDWKLLIITAPKIVQKALKKYNFDIPTNVNNIDDYKTKIIEFLSLAHKIYFESNIVNKDRTGKFIKPDAKSLSSMKNVYNALQNSSITDPEFLDLLEIVIKAIRAYLPIDRIQIFAASELNLPSNDNSTETNQYSIDSTPDSSIDLSREVEKQEILSSVNNRLNEACDRLNPKDNHLLLLRYGLDLKQKDVGALIGRKQYYISDRLTSIRNSLAETLIGNFPVSNTNEIQKIIGMKNEFLNQRYWQELIVKLKVILIREIDTPTDPSFQRVQSGLANEFLEEITKLSYRLRQNIVEIPDTIWGRILKVVHSQSLEEEIFDELKKLLVGFLLEENIQLYGVRSQGVALSLLRRTKTFPLLCLLGTETFPLCLLWITFFQKWDVLKIKVDDFFETENPFSHK